MARRAKPRKLEIMMKQDSISNNSSDSEADSEAETTRDSLPKKKRAICSGASAESNGVADDSQPGPILERPKTRRSKRGHDLDDVLSEESETEDLDAAKLFTLLYTICDNVKKNTRCLKQLQLAQATQQSSVSSSSDSSTPKRPKISPVVRQEVRNTYHALLDEDDENFPGWDIGPGKTINSRSNQVVMTKLVKEVRGLNPSMDASDIRSAAHRFYRSKCEEESRIRRGLAESQKQVKRRRERIARKRKERASAVAENPKLTEDQKKKWLSVITHDFMSSEESGSDDENIVHPLVWRSKYVSTMFEKIDAYVERKKTPQARRQMKKRVNGSNSLRPEPLDCPGWAKETTE